MANSLLVKLGFDLDRGSVSESVTGIGRVTSSLDGLRRSVGLITAGVGLKNLATSFKSIFSHVTDSLKKSYDMAEEYAAAGDRIAKTSRLIGFSVKDYQAFSSAAQHAGMSVDEMDSSLKRFSVELGKARNGDKSSLKMFDAILGGKSLSDYKDSTSLLKEIANGYSSLASAEQKAFVSQSLFGKSGLKMSELLSGGGEEIDRLIADFESRGGGFSEEGARNAELFNDELQNVKETVNSLKISVAQELFPTFIDLFKSVQSFVKENKDEIIPVVREIFACSAGLVKSILPKIPGILEKILGVIKYINPGVIAVGACFFSMIPAIGNIVIGALSIVPVITKIFAIVKALTVYAHGLFIGAKLLAGLIGGPMLVTIGLVVAAVVSWGVAIKSVYDNWNLVGDAVEWVWSEIKESLAWWGDGIWSLIIEPVLNFFKSLPEAFSNLWNGFKSGIANIGSMMYDAVFGSMKRAIDSVRSFVKGIPIIGSLFGGEDE